MRPILRHHSPAGSASSRITPLSAMNRPGRHVSRRLPAGVSITEPSPHTAVLIFPLRGRAAGALRGGTEHGHLRDLVDGVVIDSIDAYADELTFIGTGVYFVGRGSHLLEIHATGRKNDLSEGYVVGLDAVQVFHGDANTLIIPPQAMTNSPTPQVQDAVRIELVGAPSTVQPTWTPVPPRVITAAVVIAYDENGNRTVDPAEGVAGISVRVVETNTNRVIASGYTDARGYVEFHLVTDATARIVVPYFGETWELQRANTNNAPAYTLLLTPGNQPGLIP